MPNGPEVDRRNLFLKRNSTIQCHRPPSSALTEGIDLERLNRPPLLDRDPSNLPKFPAGNNEDLRRFVLGLNKSKRGEIEAKIAKLPKELAIVATHNPDNKNATRVLVVIKEAHQNEQVREIIGEDAYQRAKKSQDQLVEIVTRLGASSVFKDGMDATIAANLTAQMAKLKELKGPASDIAKQLKSYTAKDTARLLESARRKEVNPEVLRAMDFLLQYQQLDEQIGELASRDGVVRLAQSGVISLAAGEDRKLLQETLRLTENNPEIQVDDPRFEAILNKRDAHLVGLAAQRSEPVTVAVYGAGHDFKSEVNDWNKKNPGNQILLIEITPKAIENILDE